MEQKKATRAQLQKKIDNAQIFIEKSQKSIYFGDIGTGIYICKDDVIVRTNFHSHIWRKITNSNFSFPCMFLEQLVDIANEHIKDIEDKNPKGEIYYSFGKLKSINTLTEEEHEIVIRVYMFLYSINSTIFSIGYDDISCSLLLINYAFFRAKGLTFYDLKDGYITQCDLYNKLISYLRFISLSLNNDENMDKEIIDKITEIETESCDKIKKFVESKGCTMMDIISIPKKEDDEAQALNELTH